MKANHGLNTGIPSSFQYGKGFNMELATGMGIGNDRYESLLPRHEQQAYNAKACIKACSGMITGSQWYVAVAFPPSFHSQSICFFFRFWVIPVPDFVPVLVFDVSG